MAILVLTVAMPPVVGMFIEVGSRLDRELMQVHAEQLAEALTEEIHSKVYEDPDGTIGSFGSDEVARLRYDDVDDYDGWSSSPPVDMTGASVGGPAGFTRSVIVENVSALAPDGLAAADGSTSLKRVKVTVSWTGSGAGEHSLSTLVARRPGASPGPVNELLSSLTGLNLLGGRVGLSLISLFAYDAEIQGFQLSANRTMPDLTKVELLKPLASYNEIWAGSQSLPTGFQELTGGTSDERTLYALGLGEMIFSFDGFLPLGLTTFTLTVDFTNNSRSTFSFTVIGP